ncbi:MAG: hypothetical protein LPJ89_10120 [Hymenobacteraceae bacterium]|nr:hypothetical protein [Hymenobacteraceae bacterium]MDX5397986.1 hypothetical protein [Hymenobacteraceae bacterium]MDX5444124.1 hypothetical protein [Hymenobacteraceae bacterium]MDX5514058.1 hypothetical protein [Hymenobacteraceae bacterium]
MEAIFLQTNDVSVETQNRIISITWKRPVSHEVLEHVYLVALDAVREKSIQFWIVDMLTCGEPCEETIQWLCDHFLPMLLRNKTKQICISVVLPENLYDFLLQYNGNCKSILINSLFRIRIFREAEEAADWLNEMKRLL